MGLYEYLFGSTTKDPLDLLDEFSKNLSTNSRVVTFGTNGTKYYVKGKQVDEADYNAASDPEIMFNVKKEDFDDSSKITSIKRENDFLKRYIEQYENNPTTEEGVFIHAINPTTWNRPGWANNSCYANSVLWALLYNNLYKDFINNTLIKKEVKDLVYRTKIVATVTDLNKNKQIVKDNLINFQNAIQNYNTTIESSVILGYTSNIRDALSKMTGNNDLLGRFFSPDEFLGIIGTVFINNDKLSFNNTSNSMVFPIITLTPNYTIENDTEKNITLTYTSSSPITYKLENELIIDYPKLGLSSKVVVEASFADLSKERSEKFYSIGKYKLYAFIHWQGGSHYVCYFEFYNEWYQFDDMGNAQKGSIKKVISLKESEVYNESFLFFYVFDYTLDMNKNVTITDYLQNGGNTLNITNDSTSLEEPKISPGPRLSAPRLSGPRLSAPGSSSNPTQVSKNTVQVIDKCEKYGQDWLNLFIDENAVPGTPVKTVKNLDGTTTAIYKDKNTGIETSVVVADENCTFVQSNGSSTKKLNRSLSNSSTSSNVTLVEDDVYNYDEIEDNIMGLDLKQVYKTLETDMSLAKPYKIFIVLKNNSVENTGLNSDGTIAAKYYKLDRNLIDDITGIFLDQNKANTAAANQSTGSKTATSKTAVAPQVDPLIGQYYVNNDPKNPKIITIDSKNLSTAKNQIANNAITIRANEPDANADLLAKQKKIQADAEAKKKADALAAQAKAEAQAKAAKEAQAKANAALVAAQTNLKKDSKKIPQPVLNLLDTKKIVDSDNIFTGKSPSFNSLGDHDLVYDNKNNTLYMKVSSINKKGKSSYKFLNLTNGLLYDSSLNEVVDTKSYSGGTRKGKGKKHLRKTNKLRKGKRTIKHIRHKNKLKTNKLNTNKLRTRKLKLNTNKLRTRKS